MRHTGLAALGSALVGRRRCRCGYCCHCPRHRTVHGALGSSCWPLGRWAPQPERPAWVSATSRPWRPDRAARTPRPPPPPASSRGSSGGPRSHRLKGARAARAGPLNKGTPMCGAEVGVRGSGRQSRWVGGGLGPLQTGGWACSPRTGLSQLADQRCSWPRAPTQRQTRAPAPAGSTWQEEWLRARAPVTSTPKPDLGRAQKLVLVPEGSCQGSRRAPQPTAPVTARRDGRSFIRPCTHQPA